MISAIFIALALLLHALTPPPAAACPAECEAWLCLPGGFPPSECNAAEAAVLRRLARGQAPLPAWSSCRARCNNAAAANLAWTFPTQLSCPSGGSLVGGSCQGTDAAGCSFTYTARNHGNVWVHVDGQKMDARFGSSSLPYTLAEAGARNVDRDSCPPDCVDCPPGTDPGIPPIPIGVPVPTAPVGGVGGGVGAAPCNTISCPHVRHGWVADPLQIHWTLRPAPPVTHQ